MLAKVSKDQTTGFNPVGWCTDIAGANLAGIAKVFGEEGKSCIKSCEFHFKEHRNKMVKKLETESLDVFKCLCNQLLESETLGAYYEAKTLIDHFINSMAERAFLKSWSAWCSKSGTSYEPSQGSPRWTGPSRSTKSVIVGCLSSGCKGRSNSTLRAKSL